MAWIPDPMVPPTCGVDDGEEGVTSETPTRTAHDVGDLDSHDAVGVRRNIGNPCAEFPGNELLLLVGDESVLELWGVGTAVLGYGLRVSLVKTDHVRLKVAGAAVVCVGNVFGRVGQV